MQPQLSPSQLLLLLGGTLLVGMLLIVLIYAVYKLFKQQSADYELKPARRRAEDDTGLALAAMQGVIARMKTQERALTDQLREAEQRAAADARTLDAIVREIPVGLLMFNRDGFLTLSNPAARAMLEIDVWSRRPYPEILGADTLLTERIRECLETGKAWKDERIEHRTPQGKRKLLALSLSPLQSPNGQREAALCVLEDLTEKPERTP